MRFYPDFMQTSSSAHATYPVKMWSLFPKVTCGRTIVLPPFVTFFREKRGENKKVHPDGELLCAAAPSQEGDYGLTDVDKVGMRELFGDLLAQKDLGKFSGGTMVSVFAAAGAAHLGGIK